MLTDDRIRAIRALALESYSEHDYDLHRVGLSEAIDELLVEIERLRDQLRARRAEDDTKEVPL